MYTRLPDGRVRFRRPYPVDIERKQNVIKAMFNMGIESIQELSARTGITRTTIVHIISGTRHSIKTENRIAAFFGMEHDALFPPRSLPQLIALEDEAERRRKKRSAA